MPNSMALGEMGDRELLNLLDGLADKEGWCEINELADAIGLNHKHPTNCVGARLGGMRSLGTVERKVKVINGELRRYWRLTPKGEAIANGQMKAAQRRAVAEALPEERISLMQALGQEFLEASFEDALLMRRAWTTPLRSRRFIRNGNRR